MAKKKTVNQYGAEIKQMHDKLADPGIWSEVELTTIKRQLKARVRTWADKAIVIVYSPGNEQNPFSYEELGIPVKPMQLKKESGFDQVGDYHVMVCVREADGLVPAKWKYLNIIFERKGGPRTKKERLLFSWTDTVKENYSKFIKYLDVEFGLKGITKEHINIINHGMNIVVATCDDLLEFELTPKRTRVNLTHNKSTLIKYFTKKTKTNKMNVYEHEYGPGRGGPHDLYSSLYGSSELSDGSNMKNRERLHNEIDRFKADPRFKGGMFCILAECTRADFISYKPVFKGKNRNEGYGANVESRKASIASLAAHSGSPVNWCGSRAGAVDEFKNLVRQSLIYDYVRLFDL